MSVENTLFSEKKKKNSKNKKYKMLQVKIEHYQFEDV